MELKYVGVISVICIIGGAHLGNKFSDRQEPLALQAQECSITKVVKINKDGSKVETVKIEAKQSSQAISQVKQADNFKLGLNSKLQPEIEVRISNYWIGFSKDLHSGENIYSISRSWRLF